MVVMLDTCFAKFKPIVQVLAIKLNAPVPTHARDSSFGDQVAKRGRSTAYVLRGGGYVQQAAFAVLHCRCQPLAQPVGDGAKERIQSLIITGTRHQSSVFHSAPSRNLVNVICETERHHPVRRLAFHGIAERHRMFKNAGLTET
jgi:hypothetical protein